MTILKKLLLLLFIVLFSCQAQSISIKDIYKDWTQHLTQQPHLSPQDFFESVDKKLQSPIELDDLLNNDAAINWIIECLSKIMGTLFTEPASNPDLYTHALSQIVFYLENQGVQVTHMLINYLEEGLYLVSTDRVYVLFNDHNLNSQQHEFIEALWRTLRGPPEETPIPFHQIRHLMRPVALVAYHLAFIVYFYLFFSSADNC